MGKQRKSVLDAAAIDLSRQLPWFSSSVRGIRMLSIVELNDLMPAVQQNA